MASAVRVVISELDSPSTYLELTNNIVIRTSDAREKTRVGIGMERFIVCRIKKTDSDIKIGPQGTFLVESFLFHAKFWSITLQKKKFEETYFFKTIDDVVVTNTGYLY